MTVTSQGAGLVAASAFVLPALGFAIGPIFKSTPHHWEVVGPESMFSAVNYVPVVLPASPMLGVTVSTTGT